MKGDVYIEHIELVKNTKIYNAKKFKQRIMRMRRIYNKITLYRETEWEAGHMPKRGYIIS